MSRFASGRCQYANTGNTTVVRESPRLKSQANGASTVVGSRPPKCQKSGKTTASFLVPSSRVRHQVRIGGNV